MKSQEENPYLRIGTQYFKIVEKPLISRDTSEMLIPWNRETIIADFGRSYLSSIQSFNGFCCIPSHLSYQKEIRNFYNQYHELSVFPEEGNCEYTLKFIGHIFREHYELGLDYIKLLYEKPEQILPVLCLVSRERGTGKTTFLNWLKKIFDKNMTLNTNTDFRSQFNSDWANKLIIGVDEVLLDKREDSERIKNLSTARQFKSEAKGKDRQEVDFFGKFILCSNNEDNFIFIDRDEIRYWVRKVLPFSGYLKNTLNNLPSKLEAEIPAFLHHLIQRPFSIECQSRMWFDPGQIETLALLRLKQANVNKLEREMASVLLDILEVENLSEIRVQPIDILLSLQSVSSKKSNIVEIRNILKNSWNLMPKGNSSNYTRYILCANGNIISEPYKSKYYTIEREFLERFFVD